MLTSSSNKEGHFAFTLHEDHLMREIVCDCEVSSPFNPFQNPPPKTHPPKIKVKALWDTGATNCAITKKLIDDLKLTPFTKVTVHHAEGNNVKDVYKVNIILPNGVGFPLLNVTECKSTAGAFDIIIGMDVITQGDFSITNVGGKTKVSFRAPSKVHIDFNEGDTVVIPGGTVGEKIVVKDPYSGTPRNSPCPCGSGKKYKQCHGKAA
jgi:hypothetical protein